MSVYQGPYNVIVQFEVAYGDYDLQRDGRFAAYRPKGSKGSGFTIWLPDSQDPEQAERYLMAHIQCLAQDTLVEEF